MEKKESKTTNMKPFMEKMVKMPTVIAITVIVALIVGAVAYFTGREIRENEIENEIEDSFEQLGDLFGDFDDLGDYDYSY